MRLLSLIASIIILLHGCNSTKTPVSQYSTDDQRDCISRVLAADDVLGKIRNHAPETMPLSQSIDAYVQGLNKLNFSQCPTDFTSAFKSHITAWAKMKVVTDKYADLRGEMHELFKQLKLSRDSIQFRQLEDNIWSTWDLVETASKLEQGS